MKSEKKNSLKTGTRASSAEEFDRMFDDGEDISEYVDWRNARHINLEPKRVNVDFPAWMVSALDREAAKLGISRQAVIKTMLDAQLRSLSNTSL